jgi:hypothetical protein
MRLGVALAALLLAAGCFSPTEPACSFLCGPADPKCPDDYVCLADGYCHLSGHTEKCPFTDAAMAPTDMSASVTDMSMPDGAMTDSATADLTAADALASPTD